ncbi:glutamate racemase [Marinobacter koreensis]|uniref:Glutamate racemase n=1 Tax=Marinobacter koreensis TaxID=335974 RepID=A0ABW0RNT3_9GAMM|nr:glutamate racemase [Marinobacter koreensis]MCK7549358.1 glutamate racemase [Marinobacter koreensis]
MSRILVFDSGVGGLSVADCIHRELPAARLVYLADTAGFPYGSQPEAVVIERCTSLILKALAETPCDVVVVACNTASTVVLPRLRELVRVPVVGVVPAIKPASKLTVNGRVGVLATPATIRRLYLARLIDSFAPHCQVELLGHPGLVRWAEDLVRGQPVPRDELAEAIEPLLLTGVDTVVLGCTHYPLLRSDLEAVMPGVRYWVDSGDAIARRVHYLLKESGIETGPGSPGSDEPPVSRVLLSGALPDGLLTFMASIDLVASQADQHWGGLADPVRAAGSA